ncbi:MAG: hypothetical protein R2708_07710 [Vicinamibacterales bacterium]
MRGAGRWWGRALAGGAFAVLAAAAGCRDAGRPEATGPRPAATITWREIGSWSGRLNRQTESFEVSTTPMRLRWRTMDETSPGAGRLVVTLHSAVSGRPLQTIVDAHGVASAVADVADEPRWSHLTIEVEHVGYELTLEQPFAGEPR